MMATERLRGIYRNINSVSLGGRCTDFYSLHILYFFNYVVCIALYTVHMLLSK